MSKALKEENDPTKYSMRLIQAILSEDLKTIFDIVGKDGSAIADAVSLQKLPVTKDYLEQKGYDIENTSGLSNLLSGACVSSRSSREIIAVVKLLLKMGAVPPDYVELIGDVMFKTEDEEVVKFLIQRCPRPTDEDIEWLVERATYWMPVASVFCDMFSHWQYTPNFITYAELGERWSSDLCVAFLKGGLPLMDVFWSCDNDGDGYVNAYRTTKDFTAVLESLPATVFDEKLVYYATDFPHEESNYAALLKRFSELGIDSNFKNMVGFIESNYYPYTHLPEDYEEIRVTRNKKNASVLKYFPGFDIQRGVEVKSLKQLSRVAFRHYFASCYNNDAWVALQKIEELPCPPAIKAYLMYDC